VQYALYKTSERRRRKIKKQIKNPKEAEELK
jgi:hypothetical protein